MEQGDRQVEQEKKEEEEYETFLYRFQQQIIDAWKPVPYTKNNVVLYAILSVICIATGIALILTAPKSPVLEERYDRACDETSCDFKFELTETMPKGAFLYYGFTNYYQNHRRYLKFFSFDQMDGNEIDSATAKSACGDEAYLNEHLGVTTSISNTALDAKDVAYPCGQRALTFKKVQQEIENMKLYYENDTEIGLDDSAIAWPEDDQVYSNSGSKDKQWLDITNQHWLVWFRPGAMKDWFKLRGKITTQLPEGTYKFKTTSSEMYDIKDFGTKAIHISTSNGLGNRDHFLGIAFLALGGGCVIVLIVFIAKLVTEIREKPKSI